MRTQRDLEQSFTYGGTILARSVVEGGKLHGEISGDNVRPATLFSYRVIKRGIDVALVLLFAPFLFIAIAVIALVVRIDSRGPIFFRHVRIGMGGEKFVMLKFRTMHVNAESVLRQYLSSHPDVLDEWRKTHKLRYDPRITRVGLFLRQFSLDEVPQFWNVLCGHMSLVGPRPIVKEEIAKYGHSFRCYQQVKPGLTGLWQVSGRSHVSYPKRVALDCKYVRTWSNFSDLTILLRTFSAVISRRGAF